MKYRIHIKGNTDEAIKEELREVAYIITGLREATKECKRGYKSEAVRKKLELEHKADAWIAKHKVFYQ